MELTTKPTQALIRCAQSDEIQQAFAEGTPVLSFQYAYGEESSTIYSDPLQSPELLR